MDREVPLPIPVCEDEAGEVGQRPYNVISSQRSVDFGGTPALLRGKSGPSTKTPSTPVPPSLGGREGVGRGHSR